MHISEEVVDSRIFERGDASVAVVAIAATNVASFRFIFKGESERARKAKRLKAPSTDDDDVDYDI